MPKAPKTANGTPHELNYKDGKQFTDVARVLPTNCPQIEDISRFESLGLPSWCNLRRIGGNTYLGRKLSSKDEIETIFKFLDFTTRNYQALKA